jgi:uncharacterized membrane protein YdfJ with MMPL/SSD domain
MIGLGVGIDYALFIVTRHRSQLAEGMESRESVARVTATAGGAVVFAGGTVIIALLSLAAARIPLVTTLIGLEDPIPIVSFVPLMMFAILFGLSMDYEVFLMTHVREQWNETNDPNEAVVHGLASTTRVITSAAMIMVSVFLAFVINGDPTVKQFALGMAVAVAVDATVVRCVLVPAIMSLLGSSGWWLPKWMEHATPKFSIEGNEWFAEYEAPAEQANALQARPEGPTSPTAPTDRRPPQIGRTINAESSACSSPRMLAERKPET